MKRALLPPLHCLVAFESAARHASISRAAEELHLTQSAISRQILQLEGVLGTEMFNRVRKRIVLTDAGRAYLNELRPVLASLWEATHNAMAFAGRVDTLNLAVLPTFATRWLIPRLPLFQAERPEIVFNLATRIVNFDFAEHPLDGAIHFGYADWPGATCYYLTSEELVPVCNPDYRRRLGISTLADLSRGILLHQSTRPFAWAEWLNKAGVARDDALFGPRFDQFAMTAQAAAAGMGHALMPKFLIEEELASGRLEILFDLGLPNDQAYYFVCPDRKLGNPLVEAFRQWITEQARQSDPALSRGSRRASEH